VTREEKLAAIADQLWRMTREVNEMVQLVHQAHPTLKTSTLSVAVPHLERLTNELASALREPA
jgi:hypothetical protein